MIHNNFKIREIQVEDNSKIAKAIRDILIEFGVPKVGTAYADTILDTLFEAYSEDNCIYYVIEKDNEILGGAGIKQLENYNNTVCELQKMYFLPNARGIGLGSKMMELCLKKAKEYGFKQCYLETLPYMEGARKLYRNVGFKDLDAPLGDTGHYSCNLWMIKDL